MKRLSVIFLLPLAWLAFAPAVRAQMIWRMTHSDSVNSVHYDFSAIDCRGEVCTVAGIAIAMTPPNNWLVFERSTDGGKTWKEEVPPTLGNFGWPGNVISNNFIQKIEQIDSLHAVALAIDSGYVLRTTDGGETWSRMNVPASGSGWDIHFSDPMTGIIVAGFDTILTTSDGGDHWKQSRVKCAYYPTACHSYGGGMYRVWGWPRGPLYTTYDDWDSYDSTSDVYDTTEHSRLISWCDFGSGDTIIGYGDHIAQIDGSPYDRLAGALVRTTDAGRSWEHFDIADSLGLITAITGLDHDTIYASGAKEASSFYGPGVILRSTDRGASWALDTVQTDTDWYVVRANGLAMTGDGHPLALFARSTAPLEAAPIFRGERMSASVEVPGLPKQGTSLCPNPAFDAITINSVSPHQPIDILDAMGRQVLRSSLSAEGKLTFDISRLPAGVYYVSDGTSLARFVKE